MIRDNYHNDKYPFVCEGDIENPGEILIVEVNKNGTFYFYEGFNESRENIAAVCGNKQRFAFYINGKFTQDWDNAKIRCVAINNMTNGNTSYRLASEEITIRLVPADICMGVAQNSNISHPQSDCKLFIKCLSDGPVPGKCQQGHCFYDNIGMCRAPNCPFVYCKDAVADLGESTSITCNLLFCNDSFSLSIKHSQETLFINNNITGNIAQRSDDRDIQISVTRGEAGVTVTLNKTNCNHSGEYVFILDRGDFTDRADITFKVPPRKPTLLLPQSIVAYTHATITCTGEQGVPRQNMYMEAMFGGSNFTKYENTILTTDDKNCSSMGTLVMTFLVLEKWQGARVRCVIGDNSSSRLESDMHEINTTSSGVSFSPSEITGFINDTVQINCTVTGILRNDIVIISRLIPTFQKEEILSILTIGNSTKNNITGIHFSTTILSENDMIIHIFINFLKCSDGGTYYCKTGNRTATTSLAIWSKPDKPSLMLPLDAVSDGFNQLGDPFVCKGNVGYPGGNLLALIKSNGTFNEFQPFKFNLTKASISNCQKVDRLEFYLNKFTTDLHNSTLRCVATNNETLPVGQSAPFDEKVLLLVPGSTCYGMVDGLILPYPYPFDDCKKYVFCNGNRTYVRNGGCTDGTCYYTDTNRCEQERTTTTTAPTTTTQAICPSIQCLGAETLIKSAVAINCKMILCGSDFDLNIDLDSTVLFSETIHGNRSTTILANAHLRLDVESKAGNLTITFENILCNQTGAYNISIYGGNASSMAILKVRVNPEKPNITAPPDIYNGLETIFTCIGQLGIPHALMSWQLLLTDGKFENLSVQGSPIISISECSVIGNWTVQLYPAEKWNGSSIRCLITTPGNSSTAIHSEIIAIYLKEPDTYFTPPSSSAYIGSPHRLTCQARNMTNIRSVKIERHTAFAIREEVASIALNGFTTSNFNGIRINSTSSISASSATIYVDFDNLTCKDEGDYFCNKSRGHMSVLRSPKVPSITLPIEFIAGQQHQYITCFGEVGYPSGYIVAEANLTGTFVEYNFTDVMTDLKSNTENCSATFTLKFRNNIIANEWNNTRVRCVAKNNITAPNPSLSLTSEEKVILLIKADFCTGKVPNGKYSHPYVCNYFVTCSGEGTALRTQVVNCGSLCYNSGAGYCDWCDNVNCTQIMKV